MILRSCDGAGYYDRDGFKACNYCGSMEPLELVELIKQNKAMMSGSDWKYGWPHKFYEDVVNPEPDKRVVKCRRSWWDEEKQERVEDVEYGPQGPTLWMKFYSNHLELLSEEDFAKVAPVISDACGITWERREGKLWYKAPYNGFQK
jgi:hypothetical protein